VEYIFVVTEDSQGGPPDPEYIAIYADQTEIGAVPVLGDGAKATVAATPYDELGRPGKCVLSPEMVMLACYTGEDDTVGFDAILADQ
jgi:hypothetical protein